MAWGDNNKEQADSIFKLASILATFAGLCLVASTFMIGLPNNLYNSFDKASGVCSQLPHDTNRTIKPTNTTLESCLEDYQSIFNQSAKLSFFLFITGFTLISLSLLIWSVGRSKLDNPYTKDLLTASILLIITFVGLSIFGYFYF